MEWTIAVVALVFGALVTVEGYHDKKSGKAHERDANFTLCGGMIVIIIGIIGLIVYT